ncbi:MAG TPA: alpha/beta hydrolase [Gemmatimonadaceae bacterium]|nr:alpha/beta hydrolase [Gemmatimonadaceae bacterium]
MTLPVSDLGVIHRFVPGTGPAGRWTLFLLHGTGGDENDLLSLGAMLLPGAARLAPRGQVLEHGMPRFFRRRAVGVFDEVDLARRTGELAAFLAAAAALYGFDASRVIAVGYSNGANIAASALLTYPQLFAGAVLFRAMVPFEPATLPSLPGTPVFLANARGDQLIQPENAARLAALLERAGARVTHHWTNGSHALAATEVRAAASWLTDVVSSTSPRRAPPPTTATAPSDTHGSSPPGSRTPLP